MSQKRDCRPLEKIAESEDVIEKTTLSSSARLSVAPMLDGTD